MAVLGELVELLKRWDVWKRLEATPDRVDALEARIAALEAEVAKRPALAACPLCQGEFKVTDVSQHGTFGRLGVQNRTMKCVSCGHTEVRMHDPMSRVGRAR